MCYLTYCVSEKQGIQSGDERLYRPKIASRVVQLQVAVGISLDLLAVADASAKQRHSLVHHVHYMWRLPWPRQLPTPDTLVVAESVGDARKTYAFIPILAQLHVVIGSAIVV